MLLDWNYQIENEKWNRKCDYAQLKRKIIHNIHNKHLIELAIKFLIY